MIDLDTHIHDEVDDGSTLSSKTDSKKSVVITPNKNDEGSLEPEITLALQQSLKHQLS